MKFAALMTQQTISGSNQPEKKTLSGCSPEQRTFANIQHTDCSPEQRYAVNDHHSELNRTVVAAIQKPRTEAELAKLVVGARMSDQKICISGGRHAMGGQQFYADAMLIDMTDMNSVLKFDNKRGLVTVEAGIMWSALIAHLQKTQKGNPKVWTISQKQTGCDLLTIGGALAANVHGRGLNKGPIVEDIENFRIILSDGSIKSCSRSENLELFRLAIGGYGAFGIVSTVTLRLAPQVNLQRSVRVCRTADAVRELELSKKSGATFGDFQFAIDHDSEDFLQVGIVSTYAPIDSEIPASDSERKLLSEKQWEELLYLAHCDKSTAFEKYKQHYLSTDGQIYRSDTFQSATYLNGYHRKIDERLNAHCKGSEAITELYVPNDLLGQFMSEAAEQLRQDNANVIYGTVRLINRDAETFLPWASSDWACIIFNLHVQHDAASLLTIEKTFKNLYDLAIKYGGKYYLTYNKFATATQVLTCYPRIPEFLDLKRTYDPGNLFTSSWLEYLEDCRNAV